MRFVPYRRENRSDVGWLHAYHAPGDPSLTDPEHPLNGPTILGYDGDRLVASGTVRHVAEGFLVLDKTWGDPRARLDAVETIVEMGCLAAARSNLVELYTFTDSERFAKRLFAMPGAMNHGRFGVAFDLRACGG